METVSVAHEIHCSADCFWKTFFDPSFSERLFMQDLGFRDYCVIARKESPTAIECRSTGVVESRLPAPLRTLTGPAVRYMQEGSFDKRSGRYHWQTFPSRMADRLHLEGSVRIEPLDEHRVRRIVEVNVEARIFALGGLLETNALKELVAECEVSAAAMNRYFDARH